jgi:hypothetical protein
MLYMVVSVVMPFTTMPIAWWAISLLTITMLLVFLRIFLFLVLLVLVLQHVRADGSNSASCQRPEYAAADFVAEESTAGAADQCSSQATLAALLSWFKACALWLSWTTTVLAVGRLGAAVCMLAPIWCL